jgi:hypothetical protein
VFTPHGWTHSVFPLLFSSTWFLFMNKRKKKKETRKKKKEKKKRENRIPHLLL